MWIIHKNLIRKMKNYLYCYFCFCEVAVYLKKTSHFRFYSFFIKQFLLSNYFIVFIHKRWSNVSRCWYKISVFTNFSHFLHSLILLSIYKLGISRYILSFLIIKLLGNIDSAFFLMIQSIKRSYNINKNLFAIFLENITKLKTRC